jgi:hypothetical protein
MSSEEKDSAPQYITKNIPTNLLEILIAKWWNWWHTIPADKAVQWPAPTRGCLIGNGGDINGSQSVVFLGNPLFATIENKNATKQETQILDNQAIFFPVYNSVCDTSMPKFRKVDYNEMRKCAENANSGVHPKATLDSVEVKLIEHYTEKTFDLTYSESNPYRDQPGDYVGVGGGIYAYLEPLGLGKEHKIEYSYDRHVDGNDESGAAKYTFSVAQAAKQ